MPVLVNRARSITPCRLGEHAFGGSLRFTRRDRWPGIAALYEVLAYIRLTHVIQLNRAVTVGRGQGPERGLALVDELTRVRALKNCPQLPAVCGELLARMGRDADARAEFARAAQLTRSKVERSLFLTRAAPAGTRDSRCGRASP